MCRGGFTLNRLGYTLWYNDKYVDDIARAAAAGTSRQAATCSPTPTRAMLPPALGLLKAGRRGNKREAADADHRLPRRRAGGPDSAAAPAPGSRHRPLPAPVSRAETSQHRPCPPARSRRTGQRAAQILDGPAEDPQLSPPGDRTGQCRDGADPNRLRSSWKELTVTPGSAGARR